MRPQLFLILGLALALCASAEARGRNDRGLTRVTVDGVTMTGTGRSDSPLAVALTYNETLYASASVVSISNTTAASSMLDTTCTLPAGFWEVGKKVRLDFPFYYHSTGTPNIQFIVTLGGSTIVSTGNAATANNINNRQGRLLVEVTCLSVGESGTITAIGATQLNGSASFVPDMVITSPATVNTQGAMTIGATVTFGTANSSNSVTVVSGSIIALN